MSEIFYLEIVLELPVLNGSRDVCSEMGIRIYRCITHLIIVENFVMKWALEFFGVKQNSV